MRPDQVQALCETTKDRLSGAIKRLEQFLNTITLEALMHDHEPDMEEFYQGYLSDLRQLLVFSEVYYEKLGTQLRRRNFNAEQAERVLYDTYHQCVNRFYYPKNECYSEEGRYAYIGQDAIRFRKKPVRAARDIVITCAEIYDGLREELGYYETEYANQRRLQEERA